MKDAFHAYYRGSWRAVNPAGVGTKAAAHYVLDVPGGNDRRHVWQPPGSTMPLVGSSRSLTAGSPDADEFYERITPHALNEDERRVHRQALAGMLWSKQYYY